MSLKALIEDTKALLVAGEHTVEELVEKLESFLGHPAVVEAASKEESSETAPEEVTPSTETAPETVAPETVEPQTTEPTAEPVAESEAPQA